MRVLLLFAVMFFIASCHQQENRSTISPKTATDSLWEFLRPKIEKFSITTSENLPDSNELVFFYEQRFDTSFLVHFKRAKEEVRGVVYQVAMPYHRDEIDLTNDRESLAFFEGYSFKIDSIRWQAITKEADIILTKKIVLEKNNGCFDSPFYFLIFNSKIRCSDNCDEVLLPGFAAYLKDSLLNQCMAKKPKWTRVTQ
ncbi:hypothetical protein [Chitinophaga rupis]|nr:hypothetical protein [Chitinophaga rupis]